MDHKVLEDKIEANRLALLQSQHEQDGLRAALHNHDTRIKILEARSGLAGQTSPPTEKKRVNLKTLVDPEDMPGLLEKLNDLLDKDSGLTNWVVEFIDSMSNWRGPFSLNQADKLSQVWEENCG